MEKKINEATLRLFKVVYNEENTYKISDETLSKTISKGILFNVSSLGKNESEQNSLVDLALNTYGKNLFNLNNTFHKTWKTVEEIDPSLHYLQQLLHYITTYGYDSLGIPYDASHAYIPGEKVPMPEGVAPYNFIIIRVATKEEIGIRVSNLIESGVALSSDQVRDVLLLINSLEIDVNFDSIKNKEVRTALWVGLDKKPYINVDEFLRALTYIVVNDTLLIRSYRKHQAIKMYLKYNKSKCQEVARLLKWYTEEFGIENIASNYLRNRMIFLAFKCDETKTLINQINRKADKFNKPKEASSLSEDDILEGNVYQLVKYWNYCNSMLNPTKDKLYQIRNGKNYLAENNNYGITGRVKEEMDNLFSHYKDLIEFRLKELLGYLKDEIIVIPDYVDYKVPSSLKRLASGVPEGTTITFEPGKPFVVGIHWENQKGRRVDLDLHANSKTGSYGWNRSFRSDDRSVLYTGDMTDAPIERGGASEAYRFEGDIKEPFIVTLNDYSQLKEVAYQFVFDIDCNYNFGNESRSSYGSIFSKNARTLNAKISLDRGQNTLGVVLNGKFYFLNSSIFSGAVTQRSELLQRLTDYYEESQKHQLSFKQLAEMIGCKVVSSTDDVPEIDIIDPTDGEVTRQKASYIDLSLEAITEDTFPLLFAEQK